MSTNIAMSTRGGLTRALNRAPGPVFVAYAAAAAFSVYFCMYAFRKPFDALTFDSVYFLGTKVTLKTACVLAQIIGYMISKYLGTKICSETRAGIRAILLVGLILTAELGLLIFALVPDEWKPAAMLINGLPLGMVWGLVVRYLEGRRSSELLLSGMSMSFIIAGAMTRDFGRDIVIHTWDFAPVWMPFITGVAFFVPFVLAVWLLDQVPPPSVQDADLRAPRQTMDAQKRWEFLKFFGWGFVLVLVPYFFLTAFRDFRDHYGAELIDSLGLSQEKAIFSQIEKWAMFAAIAVLGGLGLITDNRRALIVVFLVIAMGFAIIGGATLGYQGGQLSGFAWMAWVGVGLYLAYIPYGAILFERMMAASRLAGTSVFAIQLADGVGYTGSVLVQLYRDLAHGDFDRLTFFVPFAYAASVIGVVFIAISAVLTLRRIRAIEPPESTTAIQTRALHV